MKYAPGGPEFIIERREGSRWKFWGESDTKAKASARARNHAHRSGAATRVLERGDSDWPDQVAMYPKGFDDLAEKRAAQIIRLTGVAG